MSESTDRIEREIVIKAPRARVWRAISDTTEFGKWFRVTVDGQFTPGAKLSGHITYPGYEHLRWNVTVERMEAERLLSWRWHPYAADPAKDYSDEPTTLVEITLEDAPGGTKVRVVESGFDRVPHARRAEAFRMNSQGWSIQLENVARHVLAGE